MGIGTAPRTVRPQQPWIDVETASKAYEVKAQLANAQRRLVFLDAKRRHLQAELQR
jgi:hypothetical protein